MMTLGLFVAVDPSQRLENAERTRWILDVVRTYFTSSMVLSTAARSERSSLTICGGDALEKPVPTASQSLDSEKVRRTCRPSRPVAPVMSATCGMVDDLELGGS